MAHLSSCYFCGNALESPVQTYELPGQQNDRTTVTLCLACKEKLGVVLDGAGVDQLTPADEGVEIPDAEEPEIDVDRDGEGSSLGESVEPVEIEDVSAESSETTVETEDVSTESTTADTETGDTAEEVAVVDETEYVDTASTADGDEQSVSDDDRFGEDELTAEMDTDAGDETDEFDERAVDFDDGTEFDDETTEFDDDTDELDGSIDDGPLGDEELLPDDDPLAAQEDGPSETDEDQEVETDEEPGDETDDQEAPKTTISALEYNRVMRMLQNREFPVERDEIEVVAANAYDLGQSECAQVIDLAVERGLLDERDGELYRPED